MSEPNIFGVDMLSATSGSRDQDYYFDDGNLLLLVDLTLFKVRRIRGRECAAFRPGSNSINRIVAMQGDTQVTAIPDIKAEQFRNFLLMFYGLSSDQEYRWLLCDIPDTSRLTITGFRVYLDVADLADRFNAPKLQTWAHGQLKKTARLTDARLSRYPLNSDYQLRAIRYARRMGDDELLTDVRKTIQLHFFWVSKDSPIRLPAENTLMADTIRKRAVELYKDLSLRVDDPPLFGFVFCYVLSLGAEFGSKVPLLTRNDRVALLSAQVYLTPLPVSSLDLDWFCTLTLENRRGIGTPIESCSKCDFYPAWEAVFGGDCYKQLRENATPLFGISQLARLPYQRLQFSDLVEEMASSDCQQRCGGRILDFVEGCIQNVYVRLIQYCRDVE
ncbi:hypothetical protein FRC09_020805 [Ceratobasidium sp. 395]|nr:hypothetical protein FRC09_020805 [Ceratobasidium sp. 395]